MIEHSKTEIIRHWLKLFENEIVPGVLQFNIQ